MGLACRRDVRGTCVRARYRSPRTYVLVFGTFQSGGHLPMGQAPFTSHISRVVVLSLCSLSMSLPLARMAKASLPTARLVARFTQTIVPATRYANVVPGVTDVTKLCTDLSLYCTTQHYARRNGLPACLDLVPACCDGLPRCNHGEGAVPGAAGAVSGVVRASNVRQKWLAPR